jgi:hypothetical protein
MSRMGNVVRVEAVVAMPNHMQGACYGRDYDNCAVLLISSALERLIASFPLWPSSRLD